MKIIKCRLIPEGYCVNLFGTFWARDTSWIDRYVVNHERIHTAQQREMLFLPFYIFYLIELCIRRFQHHTRKEAYYNISFEREAYKHGKNTDYLKTRKYFAWIHYLAGGD